MQTVEPTVTQIVPAVTKATQSNITKLKIYLSNGDNRQNTKQKNK